MEWLEEAIGIQPGKPWNRAVQLGDWLVEAGDGEGARAPYRQALEWKPGDEGIQGKIWAQQECPGGKGPEGRHGGYHHAHSFSRARFSGCESW